MLRVELECRNPEGVVVGDGKALTIRTFGEGGGGGGGATDFIACGKELPGP
jgi:hypothetical protein